MEIDLFATQNAEATAVTVEVTPEQSTENAERLDLPVVVDSHEPKWETPTADVETNAAAAEDANDVEVVSEELREAREDFIRASMNLARAQKAVKRCKKEFDFRLEAMMDLTGCEIGYESEDEPQVELETTEDARSTTVADSPTTQPEPAREVPRDDWQSVSIDALGLKESLAEKLKEAGLDTIGRLESRRAEIYSGFEKWPKGIGKAKVTEIEDAILNWLSSNRPDDDKIATEIEQDLTGDAEPADEPSDEPAAESDGSIGDIEKRAAEICDGSQESFDARHANGNGYWQSGRDAFARGDDITECCYTPGDEQDDWIRGWKFGQWTDSQDSTKPVANVASVESDITESL